MFQLALIPFRSHSCLLIFYYRVLTLQNSRTFPLLCSLSMRYIIVILLRKALVPVLRLLSPIKSIHHLVLIRIVVFTEGVAENAWNTTLALDLLLLTQELLLQLLDLRLLSDEHMVQPLNLQSHFRVLFVFLTQVSLHLLFIQLENLRFQFVSYLLIFLCFLL